MLQFIVLGQIPWTHLQLSFNWFSLIMIPALAYGGQKLYLQHARHQAQRLQQSFDVISLSSLDRA